MRLNNLAGIAVLFASVCLIMNEKKLQIPPDIHNFNELKPEYLPDNSFLAVAVRNKEGVYPDVHRLPLSGGLTGVNLNVFSREYIKKVFPEKDIVFYEGERFGIATIAEKQKIKEDIKDNTISKKQNINIDKDIYNKNPLKPSSNLIFP